MRLSPPKTINPHYIEQQPRSRSWGKYLYLLIIFLGFAGIGKWGVTRFNYINAPGMLAGDEFKVESPIKALVHSIPLAIGDKVSFNDSLLVLHDVELQEKIARQEGEIQRLQAQAQREEKQLDSLTQEQSSQIILAKNQAQRKREDLIGQIDVLTLKEKSLQERAKQMREIFRQTERLYQLEATTQPRFLEAKFLLEDSESKLETTGAELKSARRQLIHVEEEIQMLDKRLISLPNMVNVKSSLPILLVELNSAQEQLTLLKQSLQERTLKAPLSGVVNQIFKKQGEVVMPGESLLTIINPATVFVRAYFPQDEQTNLRSQSRVELLFDNGVKTEGIINKFYPATGPIPPEFQERYQPRQQALIAEILPLKNKSWPLTLGMGVQVQKKRYSTVLSTY